MAEQDKRRPLFLAAAAGMFVFGIVLALLGTLFGLPAMRARLHVNLAQQGNLFLVLFLGVLAASLASGPLIDRIGNKLVLCVSALLVTLALVGFDLAQSYGIAAVAAIVLGVGGGGLNISANVLVSDLYGEDRGPMLNLLGIFYGVGALFIPLLAASIAAVFSIRQLLWLSAGLAVLSAAAYALLPFPPPREPQSFSFFELLRVARYPGVLLLAVLLFCESGNEAAIGGWTSSYAGSLGAAARVATWVLAGYWAALMAGRLLAARMLARMGKMQLVIASGAGSVVGCAVLLGARSVPVLAAGVVLTGLSFAAIYPTILALAGDRYARYSGTVFGLLFSVGLTGGMIFPWAIGQVGQSFSIRLGMGLPLVSAAVITALAIAIRSREADRPSVN